MRKKKGKPVIVFESIISKSMKKTDPKKKQLAATGRVESLVFADIIENESVINDIVDKSETAIQNALNTIPVMTEKIKRSIDKIDKPYQPEKIEVTFGLRLMAEGGMKWGIIAKGQAWAEFNVKVTWAKNATVLTPHPG